MAIYVVRKSRIDAGDGQARTAREQDLGCRFDKGCLPAPKHSKAGRRRRIASDESAITDCEHCDEKDPFDHRSRIPETLLGALMVGQCPRSRPLSAYGWIVIESGIEGRLFSEPDVFRKIPRDAKRKDRLSLLEKAGHAFPTILPCAHEIHRSRVEPVGFHGMRRA